jgi:adenosine deaminase CECR1
MGDRNIEWELEEGIPQVEDPFIQQYLKGREALIAEEQKRRHGKISAISLINNLNPSK